jgi:Tfp pilus assembly protein PilV
MANKAIKIRGFMMVEVMVAVSIITVAILSAMAVSEKAVQISRQAFQSEQAAFLLEEGAEAVRILRDTDWDNISSLTAGTDYFPVFSGGTWTLSATPNTTGIFTRTVSVEAVKRDSVTGDIDSLGDTDPGSKLVTVSVSWQSGGSTAIRNLQFYIFDIFS